MLSAVNMAGERNVTVLRKEMQPIKLMFIFLKTSYDWTGTSTSSCTSNLLEFQIILFFFFLVLIFFFIGIPLYACTLLCAC